jgi:creatinine amidohydrolase
VETGLLRHLDPDHVRTDRFDAAAVGAADRWGEWQSTVNLAYDTAEFSGNGVVGDPGAGSAELGATLLDAAADQLADLLGVVASRDHSRPDGK